MLSASGERTAGESRLSLLPAALAIAGCMHGCGNQGPCDDPGEVFEAFYDSVEMGDTESAWKLLDRESRAALERLAGETKEKTGKAFAPHELIVPQMSERRGDIKKIEPQKEKGAKTGTFIIRFKDGTSLKFPMKQEGNCYRVRLAI